eukprot:CAMPEP_0115320892 /NCGR_PEP_ID=MMETSP0270-20121206/80569_1 /TAXON_ID=71861 /ORGANISM="Scrippsiella trochoidea, Strain CCMP3099" /LENGTH=55 /DNA_ID=CAMNT_0002740737 /DNA_START=63 /DNA_END=227 /DNA_ORIENTATION=-
MKSAPVANMLKIPRDKLRPDVWQCFPSVGAFTAGGVAPPTKDMAAMVRPSPSSVR